MVPHLLTIFCIFWGLFIPLTGLFSWLILGLCLGEEEVLVVSNVWWRCCHLNGCPLYVFPDFEKHLLVNMNSSLQSGGKMSCCVDWTSVVCYFGIKLQRTVTCIPQRCKEMLICGRNVWLTCCLSGRSLPLLFPIECDQTPEKPCGLLKFFFE